MTLRFKDISWAAVAAVWLAGGAIAAGFMLSVAESVGFGAAAIVASLLSLRE